MASEQHFNLNSSFHPPCFANSSIYSNLFRLRQWLITKAFGCKTNVQHTWIYAHAHTHTHEHAYPLSPPWFFTRFSSAPSPPPPFSSTLSVLRLLAAESAELWHVSVLSAATIKWAQRNHKKRNEAGRPVLGYASHLLPWHGSIMIQCTLGAHDTESTQQIFMRDILFFIMHTLNQKLKY